MSSTQEDELSATPYTSADNTEDSWVPKIKRRRRFSADETRVLENEFKRNSSPNQEKIQRIANKISTPRKIVTTWFQNRRAKNKRREKLKREEAIASKRRSNGPEEESCKNNSSSQATDDENTSEEEDVGGNYDRDSGSDYGDTNDAPDLNHHNSYQLAQQQSLMSVEDFNPEAVLDNHTPMISPPSSFANSYPTTTNSNHSYAIHPNTLQLPYEQHYNINIYNNLTNHFISQEHIYDGLSEVSFMRSNSHLMNYQNFLNMYYYQQHFSPYFINSTNLPSQSASSSGSNVTESICINPNDVFLNCFPQYRIQYQNQNQQQLQVREEEINEKED